jgi:hypothetical protein
MHRQYERVEFDARLLSDYGISIGEFDAKRMIEAGSLLADPQLRLEAIATGCGFERGDLG